MMNQPIRVLCVDDDDLVTEAIRIKLRHRDDIELTGRLPTADDLIRTAWRERPQVVLLDLQMPGKDPFVALRELTDLFPNVRVLVLSGHVRRDYIDKAIESGAWGFVSKHGGADIILDAIHRVAHGELALGPDVQRTYTGH